MGKVEFLPLGDNNARRKIKLSLLRVDTYQRGPVSAAKILRMAKKFDLAAVGTVTVGERKDGSLWVVDGQQRTLAAKKRQELAGDIDALDCVVFQSEGWDHEARVFTTMNTERTAVPSMLKFNNAAQLGQYPEAQIVKALSEYSIPVGNTAGAMSFPTVMCATWRTDSVAALQAVLWQVEAFPGSKLCSRVHKGLWYLLHHRLIGPAHKKLLSHNGKGARADVDHAIKLAIIDSDKLAASVKTCARGVKALLNKRARGKPELLIQLPDNDEDILADG